MSRGWKAAISIQALAIAGLVLVFLAGSMAAFQIWAGSVLAVLGSVIVVRRGSVAAWMYYANGGRLGQRWRSCWWSWWLWGSPIRMSPEEAYMASLRLESVVSGVFLMLVGGGLLAAGCAGFLGL